MKAHAKLRHGPTDGASDKMSSELYAEARRALSHLYDLVYLQRSPLARALPGGDGRALRKALIAAIEALKPANGLPARSDEQRAYVALQGRYLEQVSMAELAQEMGISERQLRRELRAGIEAVAHMLQAPPNGISAPQEAQELDALQLEESSEAATNLAAEVRDLMLLTTPLARESGVTLVEAELPESLLVRASRVLLRQALLGMFSEVLALHPGDTVQLGARQDRRVLFWMSPLTQLAPTQEPRFDLVSPPLLAALHADVQAVRAASGQPQYQLWLEPAPLRTVLVVDDNESLQRLFRRYLTGLPYAVLGAQSAAEGLEMARRHLPDLIMLDIMMPRQDGWELLGMLQAAPDLTQIPVVICSVLSHETLARSLGVAGYLKKPVAQDALVQMVRSVLGGRTRQ